MLSFDRYGESGKTPVQALVVLKPLSHFKVQGFHRTNIIEALSTDYFSTYIKLRMSPLTLGGYTILYCFMLSVFVAKYKDGVPVTPCTKRTANTIDSINPFF